MKEKVDELLRKYIAGECNDEELRLIDEWFDSIADRNLELTEHEKNEVEKDILMHVLAAGKVRGRRNSSVGMVFKVAASLALIVLVGYLWFKTESQDVAFFETGEHKELKVEEEIANSGESIQEIVLPDSSIIDLSPGSNVKFSKDWSGSVREVHLTGQAFFNVRKDSVRPFLVYSGSVVTRVLGTSFSVSAPAGAKSVEVMVRTGKVRVYENTEKISKIAEPTEGVVLTPNETVKYYVEHKHWVTGLVDRPQPVIIENMERDFIFNDTPLKEIINYIAEHYQIEVVVENESAVDCSFTGDVSKMELHDMLSIICGSIGTRYEVTGSKILITGDGCRP